MSASRRAIIVGASSGIGRALAQVLSNAGYELGLTARRMELLQELRSSLPQPAVVRFMDLKDSDASVHELKDLIAKMGGVDLIVLNSGINRPNEELALAPEMETVDVNVCGFTALACASVEFFKKQGSGHLVGISSLAGLRGSPKCPAYSAGKAYVSNYLEALRFSLTGTGIAVTDIRPGFVDTAMIAGRKSAFWVASPERAAEQIYSAIQRRRAVAYVTRRWFLIACLYRWIPGWLFTRLYRKYKN